MRNLSLFVVCAALLGAIGCRAQPTPEVAPTASKTAGSPSGAGGGSDEVRPLAPGAGPITPVAGGEGLGGTSGGGVAQAAKERARSAAANASNSGQTASGDE